MSGGAARILPPCLAQGAQLPEARAEPHLRALFGASTGAPRRDGAAAGYPPKFSARRDSPWRPLLRDAAHAERGRCLPPRRLRGCLETGGREPGLTPSWRVSKAGSTKWVQQGEVVSPASGSRFRSAAGRLVPSRRRSVTAASRRSRPRLWASRSSTSRSRRGCARESSRAPPKHRVSVASRRAGVRCSSNDARYSNGKEPLEWPHRLGPRSNAARRQRTVRSAARRGRGQGASSTQLDPGPRKTSTNFEADEICGRTVSSRASLQSSCSSELTDDVFWNGHRNGGVRSGAPTELVIGTSWLGVEVVVVAPAIAVDGPGFSSGAVVSTAAGLRSRLESRPDAAGALHPRTTRTRCVAPSSTRGICTPDLASPSTSRRTTPRMTPSGFSTVMS